MQMLVTVIHTITREVLDGYRHAFLLHALRKRLAHGDNRIRIIPIGAYIGNRIKIIYISVHDRRKRPVAARSIALGCRYLA